jgi:hypothetical protein
LETLRERPLGEGLGVRAKITVLKVDLVYMIFLLWTLILFGLG